MNNSVPGKVMVVDDDEFMRNMACRPLRTEGYQVMLAKSGEEALAIMKEAEPDVILLDIAMPGIDGFEVCRRLRSSENIFQGKIIILSGKNHTTEKVKGLEIGADDYLTKPFQIMELVARVNTQWRIKKVENERNALLKEIKEDLELGAAIQSSYLTNSDRAKEMFNEAGFHLSIFNKAPRTISGDFFFPKTAGNNGIGFFLADVCGHGIPAALISMRVLSIIDQIRSPTHYPSEFLETVNSELQEVMPRGRFVAGSYLILHQEELAIANAAQPYPILVRGGEAKEALVSSSPLGQMPDIRYENFRSKFLAGERLILYTDGIIELENAEGELYGEERLLACINKHTDNSTIDELERNIIADIIDFNGGGNFDDDVTLIIIEKK